MVSIERIASARGVLGNSFEKKEKRKGEKTAGPGRGESGSEGRERRRREFMFRTHGNLWAANWGARGSAPGEKDEKRRWRERVARAREGASAARNF